MLGYDQASRSIYGYDWDCRVDCLQNPFFSNNNLLLLIFFSSFKLGANLHHRGTLKYTTTLSYQYIKLLPAAKAMTSSVG